MSRLRPIEMSALAQLAYAESAGLREDVRRKIVMTLSGDARQIARSFVGETPRRQAHRAAAAQLRDWAARLRSSR